MALLVAACGGSSSTGAGGGASATSGGSSGTTAGDALYQQELSYSKCMRSHGVPGFPDPPAPGAGAYRPTSPATTDTTSPVYQQAANACQHLRPGGGLSNAEQVQQMSQLLKFAVCVRAHGEPDFPDPTLVNGVPNFNPADTSLNLNNPSPQLQAAENACSKYAVQPKPAGGS
jgi:hypothetical protein